MKKGFTLIEILIVALLVGIVGLGTVNVLAITNRISSENTRKVMLTSNVQRLMMDMGRDVKQGAKLESFGNKLIIIDENKARIIWEAQNENILIRYDESGNAKMFLFIGNQEYTINNFNNIFQTSITGAYYKAEIILNISIKESSGILTVPTITNTFYCRTNPSGITW